VSKRLSEQFTNTNYHYADDEEEVIVLSMSWDLYWEIEQTLIKVEDSLNKSPNPPPKISEGLPSSARLKNCADSWSGSSNKPSADIVSHIFGHLARITAHLEDKEKETT